MSNIGFEIIFIVLLILANGLFAMTEIAIVSARKSRLQQLANEGNAKAGIALALANDPNQFLSTAQVGITLVGILAGAYGGATIAETLAVALQKFAFLVKYSEVISLAIVVVTITFFSLILGELVPKRLALNNPEKIAAAMAAPMRFLSVIASPMVRLLSLSTDLVLRVLGMRPSKEPPVTEEEIKVLMDQGLQAGLFEEAEKDMVESVFNLGDTRLGALMTPRTEMEWLDIDDSAEEIARKLTESDYSRFPVAQGSLDTTLGVVRAKDLLTCIMKKQEIVLKDWLLKPLFVPESAGGLKVLELFKQSRTHIALVVDEYGSIQGMVTLYDILEAIVGDLPSIDDMEKPLAVQRKDGSWLLDGMLSVDEFKEIFSVKELPEEGSYQTLGGFVMAHLGRIPSIAETFEWEGMRFEVMDMDEHRVDQVLLIPRQQQLPSKTDPEK
jgi:putative hemolysin